MNETLIQKNLHSIAVQKVPDTTDLWPAIKQSIIPTHKLKRGVRRPIVKAALVVIVMISFLIISVVTIQPVRAFSMELLWSFSRSLRETLDIEFTMLDPIRAVLADDADFYADNLDEASDRVGFDVFAPEILPDGYYLEKIMAFKGIPDVSIWYKHQSEPGFIVIREYSLWLSSYFTTECVTTGVRIEETVDNEGRILQSGQETLFTAGSDECEGLSGIGKNAEIKVLQIEGRTIEYVQGRWVIHENTPDLYTTQTGEKVAITYVWDSEYPWHQFRWLEDELQVEIDAGDFLLTLEDYVVVIESMLQTSE